MSQFAEVTVASGAKLVINLDFIASVKSSETHFTTIEFQDGALIDVEESWVVSSVGELQFRSGSAPVRFFK